MMRRRVVLEVGLLFALAAGTGALVSRRLLAPAAETQIARAVPPSPPDVEPEWLTPAPNGTAAPDASPMPRVRRDGARYVIDLRGVRDPLALLAGLQLSPAPAPPGGFLVRVENPAAPLAGAGVRDGDVLEAINGRATREGGEALASLAAAARENSVSFRLRRGSGTVTVTVGVER